MKINGKIHYLWRAAGTLWVQRGNILDILIRSRRKRGAGKKLFTQGVPELLKGCQYVPVVLITKYPQGEAGELWRRQAGGPIQRRASPALLLEQPR